MYKRLVGLIICSTLVFTVTGCGNPIVSGQKDLIPGEAITGSMEEDNEEVKVEVEEEKVDTEEATKDVTKNVTIETRPVKLTVTNISGVDLGDFSYLEPISGKELLAGDFSNNKAYYYELDWPLVEEEIQWTVYDTDREIFLKSSSSMTNAENEISITFVGDGESITSAEISYN